MSTPSVTIRIAGDKEVLRALKSLPRAVANKVIRQAVRKAMKTMKGFVAENMPVDDGIARKALIVRAKKGRRRGTISLEVQYNTDKITAHSPNHHFYPATIEYGSKKLKRKAVSPMRRAFDVNAQAVSDQATREIATGVERVAAELRQS